MKEIIISSLEANQTCFKYVKKYLANSPLSFIEKAFRKKDIKVNGHPAKKSTILKTNDIIKIYVTDSQLEEFKKQKNNISVKFTNSIVFEDNNLLIINKRKGVLVHEDKNEKVYTLANEVITYLSQKNEYSSLDVNGFVPAPCHRLDRNTSGIIIFAKNLASLQQIENLLKSKDLIEKKYLCLVCGKTDDNGIIDKPLLKNSQNGQVIVSENGKEAITKYKVKKFYHDFTLLDVTLLTGRTHQIRVHMKYINHPIIGDAKYGNFEKNHIFKKKYHYVNQFLHAYSISFGKIDGVLNYLSNRTFIAPLYQDEQTILDSLE